MSYVYMKTEPGLWTVGFYEPNGAWTSESDLDSPAQAAARCAWLNGDRSLPVREPVLTCVFCGTEYPQGTPAHGDQVLIDHIRVCEKHPLRRAEADRKLLLDAAFEVLDESELCQIRALGAVAKRLVSAGEGDRAAITLIDAVIAVLEAQP